MKLKKAVGQDGLPIEVFRFSLDKILPCLDKLFNFIFDTACIPESWTKSIIIPIFKKRDKNDRSNYRPISLLDTIWKVFVKILNSRLYLWREHYNIIPENQAGFRKGYMTIDNIFTLNGIIQKLLCRKCGKCYCMYIDFSRAFDSVQCTKRQIITLVQGNWYFR